MSYLQQSPEVLREYLVYLETIMGRSRSTVNQYYLDLRIFLRFMLLKRGIEPADAEFDSIQILNIDHAFVKSITRSDVLDFLIFSANERPKHHNSTETTYGNDLKARARKLSALKGFYRYYCEKKEPPFEYNPTKGIDSPRQKKDLPKFLSLRESIDLLASVEGSFAQRDYCILTLFLNCGMRVSELAGINLTDIDGDRLRLTGKGNKKRMVYLNDACIDALEQYLPHRLAPKAGHKNALFISRNCQRISVQTIKWLVKKHLNRAGLGQKELSVHKLRHTAATLMYQNGVDVRALKEVLGHENLDTTMIYTHVVDDNLKQAADMNPLANLKPQKIENKDV